MRINSRGPQSTDPPWVRLLFTVLESRDGQIWRAALLLTLLLAGLVIVVTTAPFGWLSGALVGSTFALFTRRKKNVRVPR